MGAKMDTRGMSSVQRIEMLKRTLRSVNIDIDWCDERIRQRMVEKEVIDELIWHEYSYLRVTAFAALYAKASRGDVLSIWVNAAQGIGSYFTVGAVSGMDWVYSKVLYKRLGLEDGTNYFD